MDQNTAKTIIKIIVILKYIFNGIILLAGLAVIVGGLIGATFLSSMISSYIPMITSGFTDDSLQMFQEAANLSKEIGDQRSLAHFYSYICIHYLFKGESFQAVEYG